VATSLVSLARLRRQQGRCVEARRLDRRALEIREPKLGPDHPRTLQAMTGLGLDELACGSPEQAREQLERALAILSTQSSPNAELDELAELQFGLAQAIWSAEPERALELAGAAEKNFASVPEGAAQLAAVQAWLQARPVSHGALP
jgi:hypothetical protein